MTPEIRHALEVIRSGDETGTIRFDFDASDDRDTELEYIESSGTQYVDTGIVPNNKGGVHYIDKNRIVPVSSPEWITSSARFISGVIS